jgi:hypothetical protein
LETIEALEELTHRQLLQEAAGAYRFQHELIRQVLAAGLRPGRKRLLVRRSNAAASLPLPR